MRREQVNREDRGATAITIAISMLVLMGFTAITIDGGLAYGDRRVLASAADVGALAALQFARPSLIDVFSACDTTVSLEDQAACRGAEEAMEVVNGTLPGRFSLDDWEFDSCSDPTKPPEFMIDANVGGTAIPCISFTENFSKSRVKMPDTDLPTTFGRLIGFNSIRTGAAAEAGILSGAVASVQPWAIGPTGAAADQVCLMSNPANPLDIVPCNGPVSGNFGKLDLALYGGRPLITGTPTICGNAMPVTKMATNIVVGSDHDLEVWLSPSGPIVNDFATCSILTVRINEVRTQTGNAENGIYKGYFDGISMPEREGRLMCKGSISNFGVEDPLAALESKSCVRVGDAFPEDLDNTPLWSYITSYASNNVSGCSVVTFTRQLMEICISNWPMNPPVNESLFTDEIVYSPRFSAVPILISNPGIGSGDFRIKEFRPIYVSTLYLSCAAKKCDIVHSPGETGIIDDCPEPLDETVNTCGVSETGKKKITAVTSYMLTLDMLTLTLRENFPAAAGTVLFNLFK